MDNEFNKEDNNKENASLNEYTGEDSLCSPEEETESSSKKKKIKKEKTPIRELLEWVQAIIIAVVLALVIRSFVFNVVKVEGESMEGTLQDEDRMIVWRLAYEPEQGDIVVFKNTSTGERYWIKRVIATEGQHVRIDYSTNSVYVSDEKGEKKLDEPYINDCQCIMKCTPQGSDDMIDPQNPHNEGTYEIDVPKGCVFVMGDNRNHSSDGRNIGAVSKNDILGKAILRFWPLKNIKTY